MAGPAKPITSSLVGLVSGAVALIIFTAIITNAVTSAQVAGDLRHATQQLTDIREADAAAEESRVKRSELMNAKLETLQRQNAQQAASEKAQQRALADLRKALRRAGIPVPTPPSVRSGGATPKAPRRSTSPATPTPTAPSPSAPTPEPTLTCELLPVLCGFGVQFPRLQPEEP